MSALIGELARRGVAVRFVEARPDGDADRDEDGFVAELFADPIARDVARWASERALAPAALMGISLGLGLDLGHLVHRADRRPRKRSPR